MIEKKIIDVHCHLFNAKYVILELVAGTWNFAWGNYPHQKEIGRDLLGTRNVTTMGGVREFASWAASLVNAAISDCEGNYITALKKFQSSKMGAIGSLLITPLMMDIYFALDDNKIDDSPKRFVIPEEHQEGFQEHLSRIKKIVAEELEKLQVKQPKIIKGKALSSIILDSVFRDAGKVMQEASDRTTNGFSYSGIEMSPGYEKHMQELEELSEKYPGKVFPFLAIDPRRIGIMKLIDLKINKGKGIFKGIKLYPPLGYLPTHTGLAEVFDYCTKYDIPITVHCSEGGIMNFRKENYVASWEGENLLVDFSSPEKSKSSYYAAPENWIPVMKRWPKLRLNFAHFGGPEKAKEEKVNGKWVESILAIMKEYENVYTDISYLNNSARAAQIYEIIDKNPILRERLMFGTDFILIMLDRSLGGLEKYYNNFSELESKLLYENAKSFLKI